jgi:hypothetical protein
MTLALRTAFDVAEKFMKSPKYVTLGDNEVFEKVSRSLLDQVAETGSKLEGAPIIDGKPLSIEDTVIYELLASSVNYCYWYGTPFIRPNDASSTLMYKCLDDAFLFSSWPRYAIERFQYNLVKNRFPLIEKRIEHLDQVAKFFLQHPISIFNKIDVTGTIDLLINMPTFASDIFVKRASLFCMRMNNRFGWYKEDLSKLPVPADYQVPKIMKHLG